MTAMKIVDRADLMRERLAIALIAFGLGIPLGAVIHKATIPEAVADARMEAACKMPQHEAESTQFIIVDGKMRCFRYR